MGPVLGPHARIDRTRDTRVAEPWLPAPEDGRPGEGQRLTPGAPHNGGRHPPRGRPSATPTASNAGPQGHTLWGRCWVHTPASTAPGTHGSRNPGCPLQRTGGRGGTAPDTRRPSQRWKAPPPGTPFRHPHSEQRRPARAHAVGPVLGPHARIDRTRDTRVAEPWLPAPEDGRPGEEQRLTPGPPSQRWKASPPGTPFRGPHSEQRRPARAHAVGPVLGPHARIDRTRDTRVAEPWLPAPEDGRPGEGQRLTPGAPHNGERHPPRGRPSANPTASNADPQGHTLWGRCWVHTPASTAPGTHGSRNPGCPLQRTGGRGGTAPDTRRPSQRWKAPPPGTPFRHPHSEQRRRAGAHAGGAVLGSHARIDRTRDTRVAEPWLPAPEDGRPGEGQRLTPGAPHNGGRHPPRGRPSAIHTASNAGPQGRTLWGRFWVHTPASTAPGTHGTRNPGCPLQRTGGQGRDSA